MNRNFVYADESSSKFWNIEVNGKSFTVTFGKIGTKGQTKTKEYKTEAECTKEAEKLIKEKLNKGYVEETKDIKKNKVIVKETETSDQKDSLFHDGKMINPLQAPADLKGGKLAEIMAYFMLNKVKDQKKFLEIVDKNKGKFGKLLENFELFYGYKPAKECIELEECFPAYQKYFDIISDNWMLEGGIPLFDEKSINNFKIEKLINRYDSIFTMLTGLERFGSDPSGDSCFISALPNPIDTTEVFIYNHEIGEIEDDYVAYSVADFVSDKWSTSYDYDDDEEIEKLSKDDKKIIDAFNKECRTERKKKPDYLNPQVLFKRVNWILGHPCGEPTFQFAEKMSDAPTFKEWEKEKKLISEVPVLANYWLLAHFFLGNNNALMECINLAKKTPGLVAPAIAGLMENVLKKSGKAGLALGNLKSEKLSKILEKTLQNASPELLEPQTRKSVEKVRGEDKINKLSEAEFNKKINEGIDPITIIAEYPEDIETHDRALKEASKKDAQFKKLVDEYFDERTSDYYNEWPYHAENLDKRLSLPVSKAFCSGLKYDQDNKKSFAGITKTLGKFDDDNSMEAYRKAFSCLNPADGRLESVVENLQTSAHSQANAVLREAAWKFFEIIKLAEENENDLKENRKKHGNTLDNMFDTKNHFLTVLNMVLTRDPEESEKIADAVLSARKNHIIFKTCLGDAFRIAGNTKMAKHLDYVTWYAEAVGNIKVEREDLFIDDATYCNFTEASIALAKMDAKKASQVLNDLFNRVTIAKKLDLQMQSGVIGGLLILGSDTNVLLPRMKRFLGNRNNNITIYGALRATVEKDFEAKVKEEVTKWVKYHLYSDTNPFFGKDALIKIAARQAMDALGGKDVPDFDDSDEYGSSLKENDLADAFLHPEKYDLKHICKRIHEKKYKNKDLLDRLKDYLVDLLEYSADDNEINDDIWDGFKALILQGKDSIPVFADLLKLEYISLNSYTDVIYTMRFAEEEAKIREWICQANHDEVLKQLNNPEPRFIAWLDLLAAHAFLFHSEESKKAIENALKSKYEKIRGYLTYTTEEPNSVRLPKIYASYGKESHSVIQSLISDDETDYYRNDVLNSSLNIQAFQYKNDLVQEGKKVALSGKIKGENWDCPVYSIIIELENNLVNFECKVENVYFQGILNDKKAESKGSVQCKGKEEALELANQMANECLLLGYKEKTEQAKKKKK